MIRSSHELNINPIIFFQLLLYEYIIIKMINKASSLANTSDSKEVQQFKPSTEVQRYIFSQDFFLTLQKLLKYDYSIVLSMSAKELKEACMREVRRLQSIKLKEKIAKHIYLDGELTAIVMKNQVRALLQLQKINEDNMKKYASPTKKKQPNEAEESRDSLVVRRYEGIEVQIQKNENEIKQFMEAEVLNKTDIDFKNCRSFFKLQMKKLKKNSNEKLILTRAHLLDTISYLLGEALKKLKPDSEPQHDDEIEEDDFDEQYSPLEDSPAYQQLSYDQINKWKRMASRIIVDKLVELAGICEQIPQLETFNRTLQFSQVENRQKVVILRIVDVLISLHHRVSYLSRNKPQLMRELQHAQEELQSLNLSCDTFLQQLEQQITEIAPISFGGDVKKYNQLSQSFVTLRRHLVKMSEVIISQDMFHTDNFDRTDRLVQLINLYAKAFTGQNEFSEQWEQLVQSVSQESEHSQVPEDQYQLIMQLQDCILEHQNKIIYIQQMEQHSNTKTNEQLEEQVNKLISDFERLKGENKQHLDNLQLLSRLREQLEMEIEERDNMIYNLSGVKVALQKKLASQEGVTHHSNRAIEEQLKKQQHQTQKYLESSLLLREQLKVSQNEREKLILLLEAEKEKNLKLLDSIGRLKPEKERLEIDNEELQEKIEKMKNDQLRQINKLNKQINDISNERDLLELELKTAEGNNTKLMERLESSEKRLTQYSKYTITNEDKNQVKIDRDNRSEAEINRLQSEIERYRRQLDRMRKELDNKKVELQILETQSLATKQQNTILKTKQKEIRIVQEENQEKDELINELKGKIDKQNSKINSLLKENEQVRQEEEQASSRYRQSQKKIKDLQAKISDLEPENERLIAEVQQKNNQISDLQKQINAQTSQYSIEIKYLKDLNAKNDGQIKDKQSKINSLQAKIARLEEQLSQKGQKSEESAKELAQYKMKQFETTIQTHKLIQIKLQEQTKTLKSQLQEKIEVQIKLNMQIDKLSKEINKMKEALERYMRELTEKQFIIKQERQKYEEQVRIIREFEIKQKIKNENQTPIRPNSRRKSFRQEETPSHIEDRDNSNKKRSNQDFINQNQSNYNDNSLSKSNIKYDIYFNAKEYDRLLKQYNDVKTSLTNRVEELEKTLEDTRKTKVDLQLKYKNLQAENRRIVNSKTINTNNPSANDDDDYQDGKKKSEARQKKLVQLTAQLSKQQEKGKSLGGLVKTLEEKIKELEKQINELKNHIRQNNEKSHQNSNARVSELQIIIARLQMEINQYKNIKNDFQNLKNEKDKLSNQLAQARQFASSNSKNSVQEVQQFKKTIEYLNDRINKILQEKSRSEEGNSHISKERDQIKRENEEMRRQIADLTKKISSLQAEMSGYKQRFNSNPNSGRELEENKKRCEQLQIQIQQLRVELRKEKERKGGDNVNIDYYLQKIRSLQQALAAVGEQLADSKQCFFKELFRQRQMLKGEGGFKDYHLLLEDNQRLFADNQNLTQFANQLKSQIDNLVRNESQWSSKERIYLQELELISRENISLKDAINKSSDKHVVTTLPNKVNPTNANYQEGSTIERQKSRNVEDILWQMQQIIEGRNRWQSSRLIQSLQRWRVPLIVCKEVEDLLNYLTQVVQFIKFLKQDYANTRRPGIESIQLQNIIEFTFRILVYFSQIQLGSNQAKKIRSQIDQISKKYSGGSFYTVLEQFTIHILENNTIEQYKRELRAKAKELLLIKEKLDELITRQIDQEEKIVNRPHSQRSRDKTPYRQSLQASPKPVK